MQILGAVWFLLCHDATVPTNSSLSLVGGPGVENASLLQGLLRVVCNVETDLMVKRYYFTTPDRVWPFTGY